MLKNILRSIIIILVCSSLAYSPLLSAQEAAQLSLPSGDPVPPEFTQEVYENTVQPGSDHEIILKVTDNVGVEDVSLYFRVIGTDEYKRRIMTKVGETDNYSVKVNADEIKPPGIEYFVQAKDLAGNTVTLGYDFSPLSVNLVAPVPQNDVPPIPPPDGDKGISKWVWIGLGALVLGAAALSGGGGGDDGAPSTATLNVTATEPTN